MAYHVEGSEVGLGKSMFILLHGLVLKEHVKSNPDKWNIRVLVPKGKLTTSSFPSMKKINVEPTTTLDLNIFIVS
jgi:hypothetical protein